MVLLTAGLLSFSRLGVHANFSDLLPGMLIAGLGMGVAMGPITTAALSTAPVDEAGVVSGVVTTSRQVGGALGIAVMGAIVAAAESLPQTDPRFGIQFVHGFQHALEAGAAIAFVGALFAALLVRREQVGEEQPTAGGDDTPAIVASVAERAAAYAIRPATDPAGPTRARGLTNRVG